MADNNATARRAIGDFVSTAWIVRHGLDPEKGVEQITPELVPDFLRLQNRQVASRKGWARRRKDWDTYLLLQGHSRVLPAFIQIAPELAGPEFWRLLGEYVWDQAEQIQPRALVRRLLSRHREHSDAMMTRAERRVLASLPDEVTLYRGVGNRRHLDGFSWTLDRHRAEFFARRFSGENAWASATRLTHLDAEHEDRPVVACGRIAKRDIIAYRGGRKEREIVALPDSVTIDWVREL